MPSHSRSFKDEEILFYFRWKILLPLLKSGRAMTFENVIATVAITEADCRLG